MGTRGNAGGISRRRGASADESGRSVSWVSVKNAGALLGVSAQTLRRWDKSGVLPADRHPANNYRVYDEERLRSWITTRTHAAPREVALGQGMQEGELVGRSETLAALDAHLESGKRLVVVVGVPGVGKTRVVRAWMERLASRRSTYFAAIGACGSVELLAGAVARSMELSLRGHTPEARVVEVERALREKPGAVLVLDEIENLDDAALCVVGRLAATGVVVVATSRVRPRLANEHVIALAPLGFPADDSPAHAAKSAAVSLFLERAKNAGGLAVVDDAVLSHVAAIVRRLEGLPLALELAASRTASVGVARLRREIDHSIEAVGTGAIDGAPHHRTLRTAVSTSIERLDAHTRALLESAAMLPQDFELEELEALISTSAPAIAEGAVLGAVRTLVDHSMISARQDGSSPVALCFGIHAVVREVVLERTAPERRALLESQHAEWRARDGRRLSEDRSTSAAMRIVRAEDGLRRAWRWAVEHPGHEGAAEIASDLACALGRLIEMCGPLPGVVEILDRTTALARSAGVDPARRAALAFYRCLARLERSEVKEARAICEEVRELASGGTSPRFEALAWILLAWIAGREGHGAEADTLLRAAESVNAGSRDPWPEMVAAGIRGQLELRRGRLTAARRDLERGRALAIRVGDGANEASLSGFLGSVAYDAGVLREAVRHYDRAITLSARQSASMPEATFRGYRATALHELGDASAMAAYDEALVCARRAHSMRFESLFAAWRAVLLAQSGRLEDAADAMDAAEAMLEWDVARAISSLHRGHLDLAHGERARGLGDHDGAARWVAVACRRLSSVSVTGEDVVRELRLAHRFLERALLAALPEAGATAGVTVGWQGGWIERDGERTTLQTHRPLRRLLWELALRRITEPGIAADVGSLVAAAWPSERLREDSATHRLRVALSTLRRFGLREILQADDGGYRLDPACGVHLAR